MTIPLSSLAASMHDEVTRVLFALCLFLVLAKLAGHVVAGLGMPTVLGELAAGIAIGNLDLLGFHGFAPFERDPVLEVMAEVGVVLLLFSIGLRSELRELMAVGRSALRVALLGVAAPGLLGLWAGRLLLPDADPVTHVFLGGTLCATSVGVTARVLEDLGHADSGEARVILGAAVADDVLGLLVLGILTGLATTQLDGAGLDWTAAARPALAATLFFAAAIFFGLRLSPGLFTFASHLRGKGLLLASSLAVCLGFAALANAVGLAAIVGAFAAGLALDDASYASLREREPRGLEELIDPLVGLLSPVFFVVMGMRVDLATLASPGVLGLGAALTVVAILGKQACAFGVVNHDANRWAVGAGMIPRGEVGLIFAALGAGTFVAGEPVFDAGTYSAVVLMVFATTLVTPYLLARSLGPAGAQGPESEPPSRA